MVNIYQYDGDKFIDSDDLSTLLGEAQDERQEFVDALEDSENDFERHDRLLELEEWDEENKERFEELKKVVPELPGDETCIRDDAIDDYLGQMVDDCYDLPKDLPSFVTLTIDYDALKHDYDTFEYAGHTYWVRYS